MKVIAKKKGFAIDQLRIEGEEFDFPVVVNEDGTNNLGSWMEPTEEGQKELDKLSKPKRKKVNQEAPTPEPEA